jgi:integrase
VIGDLRVQAVDTGLVMKILDPIWATKTETASRVRGRIESVIEAAKAYGEYVGENPARWKGNLAATLAKKSDVADEENFPALPYAELPAFMIDLRAREGIAAAALEYQILTAGRPGNVRMARWSEIDVKAATWTISYRDMKKDREHKVPLSAAALAVLERMEKIRAGKFVFFAGDGDTPLSDAATGALIDRMNGARERAGLAKWIDPTLDREIVPHGFRSSFRDWAGDETRHDSETAEFALAHVKGDKAEKAYRRKTSFEKRKELMDAWAAFATREHSADVLAFAPIATAN